MPIQTIRTGLACLCLALTAAAHAGEPALVSSMGLTGAVEAVEGITIAPAKDVAAPIYTGDLAPSQVLEIIRPDMGPISVGRLLTSCDCLTASMEKKDFAAGERAFVTVRNVKKTPAEGATYIIFVQLTAPYKEALQTYLFVKSGGDPALPAAAPLPAPKPPSHEKLLLQ